MSELHLLPLCSWWSWNRTTKNPEEDRTKTSRTIKKYRAPLLMDILCVIRQLSVAANISEKRGLQTLARSFFFFFFSFENENVKKKLHGNTYIVFYFKQINFSFQYEIYGQNESERKKMRMKIHIGCFVLWYQLRHMFLPEEILTVCSLQNHNLDAYSVLEN